MALVGRVSGGLPRPELPSLSGAANLGAGLFQVFPAGGGTSQTAVNDGAGARTRLAGVVTAVMALLALTLLAPLLADLPQAALGAIVLNAVLGFLNLPALRRIRRLRRDSFALAIFTLLGVLLLGVLGGLLLAVVISILLLLGHQSRPGSSVLGRVPPGEVYVAVDHEPAARTEPGLLVLRLDAPLLFLNAKLLRDRVREQLAAAETPVRIVLLDLQFTPDLDVESLDVLTALRGELFQRGVALWLANVRAEVRDLLRRSGLTEAVGETQVYRTLADAVPDARAALGR